MIKTKGTLITKDCTYILKGVDVFKGVIFGGNGYCFDSTEKQLLEVETIDNEMTIRVEKQFEDKGEYLYQQ